MSGPQPEHVWVSPYSQRLSPSQTYPAPYLGYSEVFRTCPTSSSDMSGLSTLSWVKAPESDMSGSQDGFQRELSVMSGFLTPQWADSLEGL
jgi:hypothetical protein